MGKEIGIDLGTTNTVVSYVNKKGFLRPLRYEGRETIPSAVFFLSEDECIIGEKALKRYRQMPEAGVINFKSLMGADEKIQITAANGDLIKMKAWKIASVFLSKILETIQIQLIKEFGPEEGCIGNVVITVPAKFNDVEKSATKKAAKNSGFESVKLAAEPTAAAIAHKNESGQEGKSVLVYDFGGGTFDVSVIVESSGKFMEVATGGDKTLGGNKLTNKIAEYFFSLITDEYGIELPFDPDEFDEDFCEISLKDYIMNRTAIIEEANIAKEVLSDEDSYDATINLMLPGNKPVIYSCEITREKLNGFILEDIMRTVTITQKVITEACQPEKGVDGIDKIVLAGGSSKFPLVKDLMQKSFPDTASIYADDVSTLISRGAALIANEELSSITTAITNVQYGVAPSDGESYRIFQTIIPENQELPCRIKRNFYIKKQGQTRLEIPYFERDIKNYPDAVRTDDDGISQIDTIVISDLPDNLSVSDTAIVVEFNMELDGTLEVSVDVQDAAGNSIKSKTVRCEKASNIE